jgi:hypothetical protein
VGPAENFHSINRSNRERWEIRFDELGERQHVTNSWERSALDV